MPTGSVSGVPLVPTVRTIYYGQWYGDRTPYYNTIGQVIEVQAGGYVSCVPSDVGKQVVDDAAEIGVLRDYDNTSRLWYVNTTTVVAAASVMTITAGTGAGTSHAANASTAGLYKRCLCINPQSANLSSATADVADYDYKDYSILVTDLAKALVLTKEFAMPYAKTAAATIQGYAKAVTTVKAKSDATRTVTVDSIKQYVYKETNAGVRTELFSEEYPVSGTGLLTVVPAAYTDPITAMAKGTIASTSIGTTDIIVLKVEVYAHVSAANAVANAIKLCFARGSAETFVELPVLVNPGMV